MHGGHGHNSSSNGGTPPGSHGQNGHGQTLGPNGIIGSGIEGPEGCNLFIRNLLPEIYDEELAKMFEPFGRLLSAKVFVDKRTKRSRCFGFVSYDIEPSAKDAISNMNGKWIHDNLNNKSQKLEVQVKRKKSNITNFTISNFSEAEIYGKPIGQHGGGPHNNGHLNGSPTWENPSQNPNQHHAAAYQNPRTTSHNIGPAMTSGPSLTGNFGQNQAENRNRQPSGGLSIWGAPKDPEDQQPKQMQPNAYQHQNSEPYPAHNGPLAGQHQMNMNTRINRNDSPFTDHSNFQNNSNSNRILPQSSQERFGYPKTQNNFENQTTTPFNSTWQHKLENQTSNAGQWANNSAGSNGWED